MNKKKISVSIVVADYYKEITDSLTNAAVEHLQNNNINMTFEINQIRNELKDYNVRTPFYH